MRLLVLIMLVLGLFSLNPAIAGFGWFRISGVVGTPAPPITPIDVYAGCPATTATPTDPNSKTWHFDYGAGHSQSYYSSNPPPVGHTAGDASYPYDDPNALTGLPTGWTKPLAVNAAWNHSGSIHSDYAAVGTVTVTVSVPTTIAFGSTILDSSGRRFILQNHTFASAGSANLTLVAQALGTASNDPTGTVFTGETGISVTLATNAASLSGSTTLTFASLPAWVAVNQWVTNTSRSSSVSNDLITAVNFGTNTITLTTAVGSAGVSSGDAIQFNGAGVTPDTVSLTANMTGGSDFRTVDTTHSSLWPGDVVELDGTTQFPAVTYGGVANLNMWVANTNASGNPDYVWFQGNGVNRPHLSGLSVVQASAVIVQGIDVDHTNPLNQYSGSTGLSTGVTFSRVATSSDTFTVNGEVWTYTSGSTDLVNHLIAEGASATDTATNTAAAMTAAAAGGDTAAQGWTSYTTRTGTTLVLAVTGWTGTGVPSFNTSILQTNTEASLGVALPLPSSAAVSAVHIGGSTPAPAYAVYMRDVYVDAGGTIGIRKQLDDYPNTGSLGISATTGQIVPGNVNGPWNPVDWIYNTRVGFGLTGSLQNPVINKVDPVSGVQCITLADTWVKHGTTSYVWNETKDILIEDAMADYSGEDNYDNTNSNNVSLIHAAVRNTVDNGAGFHPDGWQGQSTITNFSGTDGWHDLNFDGFSVYPASDTTLSALSYTDFNGVNRPLAGEPSGLQATVTTYHDITVTNSLIFSHNCPNLSFGQGYNITLANNTVLWDGSDQSNPNLFACPGSYGTILFANSNSSVGIPTPYNIVVTNNVSNNISRSRSFGSGWPCNVGITYHNNYLVGSYSNGTQQGTPTQLWACTTEASGNVAVLNASANGATFEDGGLISLGPTALSTIFKSYVPAGFPADYASQFDVTLPPGSPLKGAGTAGFGTPTTDYAGTVRGNPPSVGAYE